MIYNVLAVNKYKLLVYVFYYLNIIYKTTKTNTKTREGKFGTNNAGIPKNWHE